MFALVVSSLLVTGLIAMNYNKALIDQFTFIILLATLTTVVPYAFAAAAEVYLFIVDPKRFAGRRVVRNIVVATLGFAYAIFAIWGIGWDIIGKGFLLLMIGLPVFVYMAWSRRRTRPTLEPAATTPPNVTEPAPLVGVGGGRDDTARADHGSRRARLPQLQRRLPRRSAERGRGVHGDADPVHQRPGLPDRARGAPVPGRDRSTTRRSSRR